MVLLTTQKKPGCFYSHTFLEKHYLVYEVMSKAVATYYVFGTLQVKKYRRRVDRGQLKSKIP